MIDLQALFKRSRFLIWLLISCLMTLTLSFFSPPASPASPPPAILNATAELQLQQEQPEAALATWQQAEQRYRQQGNIEGVMGSQINQARALQVAGFYRRAKTLLEQVQVDLDTQPNQQLKVTGLLNLGNVLRVIGDLDTAKAVLERALSIAQSLSPGDVQIAAFQLANTLSRQQNNAAAIARYQQASAAGSPVQLQAQLNLLHLWLDLNQRAKAQSLIPLIQTQLENLPLNPLSIYGRIELAKNWLRLNSDGGAARSAAELLATAAQQADRFGDRRAKSYALGNLGHGYELSRQWQEAEKLTMQAWRLAQSNQSVDIAYQWQWQLGRLRTAQGDKNGAIAHYTQAFNDLRSLRSDLIAINPDVQFSFREQVEPVYRELVDLLLQESEGGRQEAGRGRSGDEEGGSRQNSAGTIDPSTAGD
jgi:tetratricopeptide (TPR) repeat protein